MVYLIHNILSQKIKYEEDLTLKDILEDMSTKTYEWINHKSDLDHVQDYDSFKNEFIEPVVAHRARLQLDDLSLSSENFLKVIGMTRKVHFLGYGLQLSTEEENKILSQTRQPIFKKVGEFMEG